MQVRHDCVYTRHQSHAKRFVRDQNVTFYLSHVEKNSPDIDEAGDKRIMTRVPAHFLLRISSSGKYSKKICSSLKISVPNRRKMSGE